MADSEPVFRIFVDDKSERIMNVRVRPSYTIGRLKELLVDRKLSLSGEHLSFKSKLLNDKMTISHYGIGPDATLECVNNVNSIRVFAKTPTGKVQPISVKAFQTVGVLKDLIFDQLGTKDGWNELTYKGRQLDDMEQLSYYGIDSDDTIDVGKQGEDKLIRIELVFMTGKRTLHHVNETSKVKFLKRFISEVDQPKLVFSRRVLEDSKSLCDYNITDGSVIQILIRLSAGGQTMRAFLFRDVESPFEIRPPSSTAPSYRQFCNGVSSEGVCVNPECIVYGEKFVCQHGYKVYRVNENPTKCPECQQPSSRVESFGFSRANIIIRAMPLGLKTQQADVRLGLSESDGKYKYLPWSVLKAGEDDKEFEFVEVLSFAPEYTITLDGKEFCSVCKRTLVGKEACNHGQLG